MPSAFVYRTILPLYNGKHDRDFFVGYSDEALMLNPEQSAFTIMITDASTYILHDM